jgi:hypothetical protein
MARIELRNCTVYIKDGLGANPVEYPCTAQGNKTAVPAAVVENDVACLVTSVSIPPAVGGLTQKIPIGARFQIAGETDAEAVHIVATRTQGGAGVNAKQTITTAAEGGTFTLTFGGKTTSALAFGITAANLKIALVALDDGYTTDDFTVTHDGSPWVVEFKGALGLMPQPLMVVDGASLTPTTVITIATTQGGVLANTTDVTTAITFTPKLGPGSYSTFAVITFLPQQIEVKIGDGDIKYSEADAYTYDKDRGELDTVRKGDDTPMDVNMNFTYEHVKTGTSEAITPIDAIKGIGGAAEWITSSADACEPYAVDVEVVYAPPCATVGSETTLFPDFRSEKRDFDIKTAMIAVTGKCNATEPEITRT